MSDKPELSTRTKINDLLRKAFKKNKKNSNLDNSIQRIIDKNTSFDIVETYKSIRTNILFSMPKTDDGKVIVVSSASPGEGKTTTSINLAITFAQTDAKIILLDCDLRKSRVHRYLKIKRQEGVSNVLCGFSKLDDVIRKDVRENLDVITAGEIPPNPAELFESEEFAALINELKKRYDYIIIDTPPLTLVTDAAVIMQHCSGVIITVRQNITSYDLLDIAMDSVKRSEAKLLGVVMVDCDENKKKYGYYQKRKYGFGYKYSYRYSSYDYKYGYGNRYGYRYGYGYGYGDSKKSRSDKTDNKKK